jgi:sulfate adenylyltransferase
MAEHYSPEIGVQTILARELYYLADEDRYVDAGEVPHGAKVLSISGTQVRDEYLATGKKLPEWFTRPEVAEVLQRAYAGAGDAPSGA